MSINRTGGNVRASGGTRGKAKVRLSGHCRSVEGRVRQLVGECRRVDVLKTERRLLGRSNDFR